MNPDLVHFLCGVAVSTGFCLGCIFWMVVLKAFQ